jgi:hypothetical protein
MPVDGIEALEFLAAIRYSFRSESEVAKRTVGVVVDPALEFGHRYQPPSAAADNPELAHDVLI